MALSLTVFCSNFFRITENYGLIAAKKIFESFVLSHNKASRARNTYILRC